MRIAKKCPSLTPASEAAIRQRIIDGDPSARNELITGAVRFATSLAVDHAGRTNPELADDLIAEALVGLVEQAQRFDPSTASNFAYWLHPKITYRLFIRTSMLTGALPVRRPAVIQRREMAAARHDLRQRLKREPTREELAGVLGWTTARLDDVLCAARHAQPLVDQNDEPLPLTSHLPDGYEHVRAVELRQHQERRFQRLRRGVRKLPSRQRRILFLKYVEHLKLTEIAALIERSVATVSQDKAKAIASLRVAVSGVSNEASRPAAKEQVRVDAN